MTEYKISVIEGDGIGPELTEATLKVLKATQAKFNIPVRSICLRLTERMILIKMSAKI